MEPVTVKLSKPIEFEGKLIEELSFREATAGDACVMDSIKGDMAQSLALLAAICTTPGVTIKTLKQLPLRELKMLTDKVGPLMGNDSEAAG
jgi:hypothetical protein